MTTLEHLRITNRAPAKPRAADMGYVWLGAAVYAVLVALACILTS